MTLLPTFSKPDFVAKPSCTDESADDPFTLAWCELRGSFTPGSAKLEFAVGDVRVQQHGGRRLEFADGVTLRAKGAL